MATVVGVKIKVKAKQARAPRAHGALGEPVWDTDRAVCFEDKEFDHYLRKSLNFYNYNYKQKDLKKHVLEWLKEHAKWTHEQIAAYADTDPYLTPMTFCGLVKAVSMGMPMRENHRDQLLAHMTKLIQPALEARAAEREKQKSVTGTVIAPLTIQDRLAEKTAEVIGEIEGQVDRVFNKEPVEINIYEFLTVKGVAHSQVGKIRKLFQRQIDEITEYVNGKDAQLTEAYSHLKKADLKRIGEFYVKLMADLDSYAHVKKATKKATARVKKPMSKDKVISKLKYLKEDKPLKMVSIHPVDVVGAKELWCFDTKTRKLIHYVADQYALELSVKGTTIVGFDTSKSSAKTLRKPSEQLAALMKAGKVALRTFVDEIRAVEVRPNGRINDRTLLLRVV